MDSKQLQFQDIDMPITGTVVKYNATPGKSSGFIRPDVEGMDDVFLSYKEIEPWRDGFKCVIIGDRVSFSFTIKKDRWYAINVKIQRGTDVDGQ